MITFDSSVVCGRCRATVSGDTARTADVAQQSAEGRARRQFWTVGTMTPGEWLCPRCESYFLTLKGISNNPPPSETSPKTAPANMGDSPRGISQ